MGEHFRRDGPGEGPHSGEATAAGVAGELRDLEGVSAVLDHPRRRRVLDVVSASGTVSIGDLATRIAALETNVPDHDVGADQRRSVAIALHHVHVPKLADAGVIEVDHGESSVKPGPRLEDVISALDGLAGRDGTAPGDGRFD